MKVTIRIQFAPSSRVSRKSLGSRRPRLERIQSFDVVGSQRRGAQPLLVWAFSMMLMIAFMSMTMFATLPSSTALRGALALDEEDPSRPIIGQVVADCRVMIEESGKLKCVESVEYKEDHSGVLTLDPSLSTFRR